MIYKFLKCFSSKVASRPNYINMEFVITISNNGEHQTVEIQPSCYVSTHSHKYSSLIQMNALLYVATCLKLEAIQLNTNTIQLNTTKLLTGTYKYVRPFNRKQRVWIKY